ncbi:MAG: M23 family metallopeptidase [Lachnospiraceae bacterium]|nr:M23 family metallopeptidase [Lachnospiraceae bacterium]
MKKITRRYKRLRLRGIKIGVLAVIASIFFMPSYIKIEKNGNNIFTVFLNGVEVGKTDTRNEATEYLKEARRKMAGDGEELVLADSKLEVEGQAVIWGRVDEKETIIDRMAAVLKDNIKQTLHRSYTVKINEYTVNLASKDEVLKLLEASIHQYDKEKEYQVSLTMDGTRELNVLTADLVSKEQQQKEKEQQTEVLASVGIYETLDEIFDAVEPAGERDFSDYEIGLTSLQFGDTVEVVESYLSQEDLTPLEEAVNQVTKEQETNQIYEVVAGDSLSKIAVEHDLTIEKLIEMNETIDNENSMIRIGDELIITVPEPELSVEREEDLYYEESYEEEVVYIDNAQWYTTKSVVRQEPSAGHRRIVARIAYRNNIETGREILKEEITYQAVPKIIERGTKNPPTYIKPISGGRLSSGFGRRRRPTRGASTYHKGIDWATPVGTAVMASSSGTVVRAGWGSGYGYVIYIDHGDGRQTRYGHLSKILVSPGQKVTQGQKIALSGNTGISSGPHIHFEILIGGSQVNPLKYLE